MLGHVTDSPQLLVAGPHALPAQVVVIGSAVQPHWFGIPPPPQVCGAVAGPALSCRRTHSADRRCTMHLVTRRSSGCRLSPRWQTHGVRCVGRSRSRRCRSPQSSRSTARRVGVTPRSTSRSTGRLRRPCSTHGRCRCRSHPCSPQYRGPDRRVADHRCPCTVSRQFAVHVAHLADRRVADACVAVRI